MKKTTSKIVKAAVEAAKASGLEQLIEETDAAHDPLAWLTGDRMILSYTPMDDDQSMKDQRILLIGDPKEKVKAMAVQYGWTNAVHVSDYCEANPLVDPFGAARAGDPSKEIVVEPTSGVCPPAPPTPSLSAKPLPQPQISTSTPNLSPNAKPQPLALPRPFTRLLPQPSRLRLWSEGFVEHHRR